MITQESITVIPIAEVDTDIPDAKISSNRKTMISTIKIYPQFVEAIKGIQEYSHIFVLFWMGKSSHDQKLQCHPRGNRSIAKVGVLSTRGRNHPNPIGLAVCELVDSTTHILTVRKLDAFHGTKIIDIKPYDDYDLVDNIRLPEWLKSFRT